MHQDSRLEPISIHNCLRGIIKKCRKGLLYELLYADDLVLVAESEKLLLEKIQTWRKGMETGALRVNFGKTKIMKCDSFSTSKELRQIPLWSMQEECW